MDNENDSSPVRCPVPRTDVDFYGDRVNTVVIADDCAEFRRVFRSTLQAKGFHIVAEASDGLEAVARATELQPDLVLLDIHMPNLNGLDAAVQIRSMAPKSRILFVSLNTDPDIVQSAMRDGAAGYLWKSNISCQLVPAIEATLAGRTFVGLDSARDTRELLRHSR